MFVTCETCGKQCKSKSGLAAHKHRSHNPQFVNPNLGKKRKDTAWNKGLTKETNDSLKRASQSLITYNSIAGNQSYKVGVAKSAETKAKISKTLRERNIDLFNHPSRKNYDYLSVENTIIKLQSSYELKMAILLDELGIKWIRPKGMFYIDEKGLKRRYYPDFLLTDYDIYLDPKNDYLIPKDTFKINSAMKTNNCKIVIVSYDNINAEFVHSLTGNGCF